MEKTRKEEEWLSWLYFSRSYLFLAKLGCKELLDPIRNRNEIYGDKDFFKMLYQKHDLFISTLYNVKHGIEIFIKTLKFILSGKLDEKHRIHNISYLFEILENEINSLRGEIERVIKERLKDDLDDHEKINLQEAEKSLNNLPGSLGTIKKLIDKYYRCDVIKDKIGNDFIIEDIDNTAFRYPENNLKIKLDYEKILSRILKKDIEIIFKDIVDLKDNFNTLGFILDIYRQVIEK